MPAILKFCRLCAALSALLLVTACGMVESLASPPADGAGRTTAPAAPSTPAKPADTRTGLPGLPAQCAREGEACGAKGPGCCGGLVCAGIRSSFCMTDF
jgi:hypothetical protein